MQRSYLKRIFGLLAGIVIAGLCIALFETLAHRLFTGEPVFAAAIVALFAGTLVGAAIAVRLAGAASYGWVVAAALGLLSPINVFSFPHPIWFVPAAILALAAGGRMAARAAPEVKAVQ